MGRRPQKKRGLDELKDLLREEYGRKDEAGQIRIAPAELAELVYKRIDRKHVAPTLVRIGCLGTLRWLGEAVCRERSKGDDPDAPVQNERFPFALQPRYPVDGEYVLRMAMTTAERRENAARLRKEGKTKLVHADALDRETDELIRLGKLPPDESKTGTHD